MSRGAESATRRRGDSEMSNDLRFVPGRTNYAYNSDGDRSRDSQFNESHDHSGEDVNTSAPETMILEQLDFLKRNSYMPPDKPTPKPREHHKPQHLNNNNSTAATADHNRSNATINHNDHARDVSFADSNSGPGWHFNHGFDSSNGQISRYSSKDTVYTTHTDSRGPYPPDRRSNATPVMSSRAALYASTPTPEKSKCANKRCVIVAVIVTVCLLVVAAVVVGVLFGLGVFSSATEVNVGYSGEVRFNVEWSDELADVTSQTYNTTLEEFNKLMTSVLDGSKHSGSYTLDLNSIYPGSIRCRFSLYLGEMDHVIEHTIHSGLKKLYDSGTTSWLVEITIIYLNINTTLDVTSPERTTPQPAPTCRTLLEPRCKNLGYDKTGIENPNLFRALEAVVQRSCYTNSLMYACTASYPACQGTVQRYPCRQMCQAFRDACSYPVNCAGHLDDDVDTLCYMSPDFPTDETIERNPIPDPCPSGQFQCGDGSCVSTNKKCDGSRDCRDASDEADCGTSADSPLDCDFEAGDTCRYSNHQSEEFSWNVGSGPTPSINTGPLTDHTTWSDSGHYLFMEASGQYPYSRARLVSEEVSLDKLRCLRLYYHMLGDQIDSLKIYQYFANKVQGQEVLLWQRSRDHGDVWKFGSVTLPVGTYQIMIEATRGDGYRADIAIDDITAKEEECPIVGEACTAGEYQCDNGNCVTETYVCDGHNDCGDYSDETFCDCREDELRCGFGMCIPEYYRCDGTEECPDGSDEANCEDVCSSGRHRCADGTCIMEEWVCDHEADCPDDSDEQNCPSCADGQYRCRDYGCVESSEICDGKQDCPDGSDEAQCYQTRDQDNIVLVRDSGKWKGLCSDSLPDDTPNHLCQLMGLPGAITHTTTTITGGAFVKFVQSGNPDDSLLAQLNGVTSCPGDKVLTLICMVQECGRQTVDHHTESYIVNGADALPGQWPWQIGLYFNDRFSCGGSLVSRQHIITAAHCLKSSSDASRYKVILGATVRDPDPDQHRMEMKLANILPNPGYTDAVWGDDVAVLTLDRPVDYTDYIKPICLPNELDFFSSASQCYVSGWGRTDYYNFSSVPLKLQEAKVKLWSDKKCGQAHINFIDSMTCAGYTSGFISNCPGDSGGPLQCRDHQGVWKLFGVFSFFVRGCNVPLQPPVFTKVQSHLSWLYANLDCAFLCDNQRCLWASELLCNGVDDCGDLSDEIRPCSPSMTCGFEDGPYQCGYSHTEAVVYNRWDRITQSGTQNLGPVTDHTYGNTTGHLMYAGVDKAALISPIMDTTSTSCVQIYYHMRGNASDQAGTLTVSTISVPSNVNHPSKVSLVSRTTRFTIPGNQLDIWHAKRINLPAGRFVVMFEGEARNRDNRPIIAVDDVKFYNNQACSEFTCLFGEMFCDDKCIPAAQQCDYHTSCVSGTDESGCTGKSKPFSCDMEHYGLCGLEQDLTFTMEHTDWTLLQTQSFSNGPPGDHTTGMYGGHVLYLSTLIGTPGEAAGTQLSVKVPGEDHCMSFYYSMVSTGAIRVLLCDATARCSMPYHIQDVNVPGWEGVQVSLSTTVAVVQLLGYVGPTNSDLGNKGYIALDDLSIRSQQCNQPSCKPDEFTCSDGTCVFFGHTCDGRKDCSDNGDENSATCACMPDMFHCSNGRCIRGHLRCNGENDCSDGSDEQRCTSCGSDEFKCKDGTCKNHYTQCDGFDDCLDYSDEPLQCTCGSDQFRCGSGGFCIPGFRFCDGRLDCLDGSDEPVQGCNACDPRWKFLCTSDNSCIPRDHRCDGTTHCANGEDEQNCG